MTLPSISYLHIRRFFLNKKSDEPVIKIFAIGTPALDGAAESLNVTTVVDRGRIGLAAAASAASVATSVCSATSASTSNFAILAAG